jgi:16S rRNA (guanine527-N7)-methyltransferase
MEWDELPGLFPELADAGRWLAALKRHAMSLEAARERVRVTAVPGEEAVRRNYAESLEVFRMLVRDGVPARLADVGSGGGFPGLVIAAVSPATEVHLVEPLQKRAGLLREMAGEMGLDTVTVHAVRGEEAGRGRLRGEMEAVTARAVAELRELLEYTLPLAAVGGMVALPKGSAVEQEVAGAGRALEELGGEVVGVEGMRPEISETLRVVLVRKVRETPERYPRRPGVPGRKPL